MRLGESLRVHLPCLVGLLLLAGPTAAAADDTICTPEYYYNSSEAVPLVIAVDADRMQGTRVTRLDLDTGAYSQRLGSADGQTLEHGVLQIVSPGSRTERSDFIAVDIRSGLLLHLSFVDDNWPFTRVEPDGVVASGHCLDDGSVSR